MNTNTDIPRTCDVVVIGAGLGGLVCGLEMQRHGLKVVIAEKRRIAGGYAHHFKRGAYNFDASLHHIGGLEGGMTHKLLGPLGVLDRLDYDKPEILTISEFPDAVYRVPNNPQKAVTYLGELFPEEKDGLKELFSYSQRLKTEVIGPVLFPDFTIQREDMLSPANVDNTFEDLLKRFISDPRLMAILSQLWMYLGLPPSKSAANFSNCVFASGFVEGRYSLRGGSKALVEALTARFTEEGGILLLGKEVEHIETENKVVTGIVLNDGNVIKTSYVAANTSPLDILPGLVDEKELSSVFLMRLKNMEPSISAFSLYIGLDCRAEELGIPRGNSFYNHGNDLDKAYDDCLEARLKQTDWSLSFTSHSGASEDGKSYINFIEVTPASDWFELADDEYKKKKAETLEILLNKYDSRFPGLKEHTAVMEFGTPRTLRRYSGNAYGALYGFAQLVSQSNNRRISNRTPIKGLFLSGAWTQAGGGYEGTMMSGMKSAHMILEENGKKWDSGLKYAEATAESRGTDSASEDISTPDYKFYSNDYTIYPDDTDWTGFAKETAFLRFMDRARVRLLEQSEELRRISTMLDSYYVKLYSISVHFHSSGSVGECVKIQTGYRKSTSHRAAVDHLITGSSGQTILTGQAEIMFVTQQEELVELPEIYRHHAEIPFESPGLRLPKLLFTDLSNYRYESDFLISYEDTDMQGVVYNVSYVKLAQKMFWDMYREILPPGTDVSRIRAEHLDIRFLNAARLRDIVHVKAGYRPLDEKHFGIDYRMILKDSGSILTDIHMEYVID